MFCALIVHPVGCNSNPLWVRNLIQQSVLPIGGRLDEPGFDVRHKHVVCCPPPSAFISRNFFFVPQHALWARASSFKRFLDHTQRTTTVDRTPLDEWPARRRDLYQTTHNTHNRQTSIELLWTSDQPVAETSTRQHTTLTTDRHP